MEQPGEFGRNWRALLAAFLGMSSALSVNSYLLSIFAPYLLAEFGWTRAQWAAVGLVQILIMFCMPVVGRLAGIHGVRKVAGVGALAFPLFLVAMTRMDGNLTTFLILWTAQTVICSTTTATVYSRVVAAAFDRRRGLALGICGSGPPLIGALGSPLLTLFAASHGWRSAYLLVAALSLVAGLVTMALLGPVEREQARTAAAPARRSWADYRAIFARPVFWIVLAACFLGNLPFSLAATQLKMVVIDQGLSDQTAALMVSAFALGSIAGRVISGVALDMLPAHHVAAVGFALPFFGLLLLASPWNGAPVIMLAVLLIGISFGGEGDVIPYLVTRYFSIGVFGTVLGLLIAAMGAAMALGNGLLALVLARTDSYDGYLVLAAAASFIGAALFLLLGRPAFRSQIAASH